MENDFLKTKRGTVKILGEVFDDAHFNHELIFDDGEKIRIGCRHWSDVPKFCEYVNYGVRSISHGYDATKYHIAEIPEGLIPDCTYQKAPVNAHSDEKDLDLNVITLDEFKQMKANGGTFTLFNGFIYREKVYAAVVHLEEHVVYDVFLKDADGTEELEMEWVKLVR